MAIVDANDDGMWADILANSDVKVGDKLYTLPPTAAQIVEMCARAIPENWLDPLLSGPNAVLSIAKHDGLEIERLLIALKERIRALSPATPGSVIVPVEVMQQIESWSKAYPLDVFPEPDLKKARELLEAGGMTLDSLSAQAMRHVITEVWAMLAASKGVDHE